MTSSHPAIMNRPRTGVVAASIGAGLGLAALALGMTVAIARADNAGDEPQPANANVQRAAQNPPPARVILPAPWEQAAPAQPVAAPAKPEVRK
ncbi:MULTISPECIES: hypothetical protein [Bradyrhizobium]|jgi:hypothetical protein|uniref:hypothetical protein n=1 Tax=Bradyrhizobium TaxID=374 RepID=UPI0004848296|nr:MULTISPECIES: hypothetical protein [Bradyrhizobium]MCS3453402.1 hypothetical protein [Bradyrhizobium elkanii]MCS3564490.1 hypothetical protein [Bradyrhizobium elkanii]MCW2145678.1 hypothetical protein [Bradyrhizobium elkanii]MCW2355253.1 hypothetical protein [Bradyrhizobium elkanii]MCW2378505.1 hypothetical protein [Bradyrhizobium elkanii]